MSVCLVAAVAHSDFYALQTLLLT